jgi:hypothetical protein
MRENTQIMFINFRKSFKFPPILSIGDCTQLEIVKQTELLSIIISDMCQRANKKIWLLRRKKILKLDLNIMLDFYFEEVRSILVFGVACWNSGLTVNQTEQI